jgi:hypothetical protein
VASPTYSIASLAEAIANEENNNPQYNNPGAIMPGGVMATYPTPEAGESALENLLNNAIGGNSQYYNPTMTLEQFEETYTGGDTNAGNNVADYLGVPVSTPISAFGQNSQLNPAANLGTQLGTPNTATAAQSADTLDSPWTQALNAVTAASPAASVASLGTQAATAVQKAFGLPSLTDTVVILAGLVLLAGAVFGFKTLTSTVVEGARNVATAGA